MLYLMYLFWYKHVFLKTKISNIFHILFYLCVHFMLWNKINNIAFYNHGKAYTLVLI